MSDQIEKLSTYTVGITEALHKKLEEHVFVVKKLVKPGYTKREWLEDAIKEKLQKDIKNGKRVESQKSITFRVDFLTHKYLEDQLTLLKKLTTYSKKQLILDAVEEKLKRDKEAIKQKLLESLSKK